MSTRRFQDDMADSPSEEPTPPPARPAPAQPRPAQQGQAASARSTAQPRQAARSSSRSTPHMPRTLSQVMNDANDQVVRGDLSGYVPLPTGFDPLDGMIGGGLRKTELVLLGGAQGIGKTIAALQMARNVAMRADQFAFYLSYEHTETHLMNRLVCLESINPPEVDARGGIKLKDLYDIIISQRAREFLGRENSSAGSLQTILRENAKTSMALARINKYADRMILVKASPAVTTLRAIREMTARLVEATLLLENNAPNTSAAFGLRINFVKLFSGGNYIRTESVVQRAENDPVKLVRIIPIGFD